jgi:hypothetical protein
MTIESQIFDALKSLVNNKVYPIVIPQKATMPAVVYNRIATNAQNVLAGGATIDQIRFQVDTYATTFAAARTLAAQVRLAMEGAIFKATLQSELDFFEDEINYYRISQDYYVWERKLP